MIRRPLTRFTGSGSTVLFSSHVLEVVEQVCDHVSIIDKGWIVTTGTTGQVRGGETLRRAFVGRFPGGRWEGIVVARLLVQLKLRLLRNALRSNRSARVAFILSTAAAGLVGHYLRRTGRTARQGRAGRSDHDHLHRIRVRLVDPAPVLTFGLDTTLDPAALALYPLRTRPLAVGLLAASATGAWPLANVHGLLGVTAGLASGWSGVFTGLVAVPLKVLFFIVLARFATTGLAGLLRSRRGRDLAVFPIQPIFALYEVFNQVAPKATEGKLTAASFAGVDAWMRWLPPGPGRARDPGRLGRAAGCNVAPGAAGRRHRGGRLVVGQVARPRLVTVDTSTQSSAVRGMALPFARYGLRGTVAARFWIYQRREPGWLIYWGITAIVMVAVSVSTIRTPGYLHALLLSAGRGAALVGAVHANAIGRSGPGVILEAAALTGRRALCGYFCGQDIALGLIAVALLTLVSFALAAVARYPVAGLLALAVDLAGIGAGLGLANIFTVFAAFPVEKRAGSPAPRAADGYIGYAYASTIGSLLGVAAVSPVVLGVVVTRSYPAVARVPCAAGTASRWPAWGCGSPPAPPSRDCQNSARSPCAASCSPIRVTHLSRWQPELPLPSGQMAGISAQARSRVGCTGQLERALSRLFW